MFTSKRAIVSWVFTACCGVLVACVYMLALGYDTLPAPVFATLTGFVVVAVIRILAEIPASVTDFLTHRHEWQKLTGANEPTMPRQDSRIRQERRSPLEGLWIAYWLDFFIYARDKGGLTFERVKEYFGNNRASALATWKFILAPFVSDKIVSPIINGKRTEFADEYGFDWVVTALGRGVCVKPEYIPSTPPPQPFTALPLSEATAETVQNAGETRETAEMVA